MNIKKNVVNNAKKKSVKTASIFTGSTIQRWILVPDINCQLPEAVVIGQLQYVQVVK